MAMILVVDDVDAIRGFIRHFLEMAGHEVIEAAGGARALQLYQARRPDLVLLDTVMPEMDGLECLRELLRLDHKARVLMISGGASLSPAGVDFRSEAMLFGAAGSLHKPMSATELVAAVDKVLETTDRISASRCGDNASADNRVRDTAELRGDG